MEVDSVPRIVDPGQRQTCLDKLPPFSMRLLNKRRLRSVDGMEEHVAEVGPDVVVVCSFCFRTI